MFAVTLPLTLEVIGFGGIRKEQWTEQNTLNLYYRFSPEVLGRV